MHIPNIKVLVPVVSDKKIYSCFLYISVWISVCDPLMDLFFGTRGITNNFGRGLLGDATYQILRF